MANQLKIDIQPEDDATRVTISGMLNEDADLEPLSGLQGLIRIDSGGLESIFSSGIRNWIQAIRLLEDQGGGIEFVRVSVMLIEQFNLISNTKGKGTVRSFFAPYYCETCDNTLDILIKVHDHPDLFLQPGEVEQAPEMNCKECGLEMEFDEIPERFFTFLS